MNTKITLDLSAYLFLTIGLALIYWYASRMLKALANTTRYVLPVLRDEIIKSNKKVNELSWDEQVAMIERFNQDNEEYIVSNMQPREYVEFMVDYLPKLYIQEQAYKPLPIKGKQLKNLLKEKFTALLKAKKEK